MPIARLCFAASTVLHPFRTQPFPGQNASILPQRPVRVAKAPSCVLPTPAALPALQTLSPAAASLLLTDISDVNKGPLAATAFVFFLTFWGAISFVKGSTKSRETQAAFTLRDTSSSVAKKTARYLMERSFTPDAEKDGRAGVMTFTGQVRASTSVASILVAVAGSGLWALTYILNFVLPENLQSDYYGWLSLAAVGIVPWYWRLAGRTEEVKVMVEEEEGEGDVVKLYVKGHRDEIETMEQSFGWKRDEPVYEGEGSA